MTHEEELYCQFLEEVTNILFTRLIRHELKDKCPQYFDHWFMGEVNE